MTNMCLRNTCVALLLLLAPASSLALARAPFPSASKLQPMPSDIGPDISGNVNSTHSMIAPSPTPFNDSPTDAQPAPGEPLPQAPSGGSDTWLFVLIAVAIAVFASALVLRRKSQ